jgi:hypothetical protein
MRKGLREVPDLTPGTRVVFLAQQSDIVTQGEQSFQESARLGLPTLSLIHIDQPEAAGQKDSLAGG